MPTTSPSSDEPSGLLIFILAFVSILVFFVLPIKLIELRQAGRLRLPWDGFITSTSWESAPVKIEPAARAPEPAPNHGLADTYQAKPDTGTRTSIEPIRPSRRLSEAELIALLAVQRNEHGNYRFSANAIANLVGGTRNEVLSQIRALRAFVPQEQIAPRYPPRTPDQHAARAELGLEQKP